MTSIVNRIANEPRYSETQVESAVQDVLDRLFEKSVQIGYEDDATSPLDVAELVLSHLKDGA